MHEWLSSPFFALYPQMAVNHYDLNFNVPSPGNSTVFVEFSKNGRFLAVGDRDLRSLYILDRLAGFHLTISAVVPTEPTTLVWETSTTFYVGLSDGRFVHYRIDLGGNKLIKGTVNSFFYGRFPTTAMALDAESKTLVLSVGPDVFAFRRTRTTSGFCFVANISSRFNFKRDPGSPAPPFPRSICFTPNNTLFIAFCRQNIASIVLEFDGDSRLHSSFQTVKIDYSGLSLLKAITSASEGELHQLTRFWVYGDASQTDRDSFPFLLINGGEATLSGSTLSAAIVKDTITQRKIQLLNHMATPNHRVSVMAYHVSNTKYNIATADQGPNATVKIWTARRTPSTQDRSQYGFLTRKGLVCVMLVAAFTVVVLRKFEGPPDIDEILRLCVRYTLAVVKMGCEIGYILLDAADGAISGAGDVLD